MKDVLGVVIGSRLNIYITVNLTGACSCKMTCGFLAQNYTHFKDINITITIVGHNGS